MVTKAQFSPGQKMALEKVEELEKLPSLSLGNAASFFSNSVSWHPRYTLIFDLIEDVRKEYEILYPLREKVRAAMENGEAKTISDWGRGWEWKARIVDLDVPGSRSLRINLLASGFCIYKGQHDRPVVIY